MSELREKLQRDRLSAEKRLAEIALQASITSEEIQTRADKLAKQSLALAKEIEMLKKILTDPNGQVETVNLGTFTDGWIYLAKPTVHDDILVGFVFAAHRPDDEQSLVEICDVFFALGGGADDSCMVELAIEDGKATWKYLHEPDATNAPPQLSPLLVAEEAYDEINSTLTDVFFSATSPKYNPAYAQRFAELLRAEAP